LNFYSKIVPRELFECTKLEHLYLRHNPISSISSGMNNLKTLVFLDMAFCELNGSLPDRYKNIYYIQINIFLFFFYLNSLFGLINLRHLDISYNRITTIPSGISNLKYVFVLKFILIKNQKFVYIRNLRQLVCDGNEITYFPSSMISMENLRLITAKNTWLLPELAKDECSTKPQVIFNIYM
jgi:Leucine-rich repeat (LRR) protein